MEIGSQIQLVIYSYFTVWVFSNFRKIVTALKNQMALTMTLMQLPSTTEAWTLHLNRQNTFWCFPLLAGKSLLSLQGTAITMPMQRQLQSLENALSPSPSLQKTWHKPVRNTQGRLPSSTT